jgi:hypothetical protein
MKFSANRTSTTPRFIALGAAFVVAALCGGAVAQDDAELAAQTVDPVVGSWVGEIAAPESEPFPAQVTFVSAKGGVSRHSSLGCGGILVGGPKGDAYEYTETITWGTVDEKPDGCLNGTVRLTLEGDVLKYEFRSTDNGQEYSAVGELRRVGGKAKKK